MPRQHATLSPERWDRFSLDEQILMIANEMNRAGKWMGPGDDERRKNCYERSLNLLDLTVAVQTKPTLRRELLRWRDLVAALYLSNHPDPSGHRATYNCLLRFTRVSSRQLKEKWSEP